MKIGITGCPTSGGSGAAATRLGFEPAEGGHEIGNAGARPLAYEARLECVSAAVRRRSVERCSAERGVCRYDAHLRPDREIAA